MTPCEEKGYKVGQVFEVIEGTPPYSRYCKADSVFSKGSLIVLSDDNGSSTPEFYLLRGKTWDGDERNYCPIECVKRIYPPEENKMVTVVYEGKETEISRESAKALNLI